MPQVIVHAVEGRTPAQKKALCEAITAALVKDFGATVEQCTITIMEAPKDSKMAAGKMFSEM